VRPLEITQDPGLSSRTILRRYIDLAKLLDILRTRELYLRRADGFKDRLEGALFPSLRTSLDKACADGIIAENGDTFWRRARLGNYVSCWNIDAKDNMALWQLYGGSANSVALTTTVERLSRCAIQWRENLHINRVSYVDHVKHNTFAVGQYSDVLQYKSEAYRYEKELRLIIRRQTKTLDSNPVGIRMPVSDLNDLIRSVVVAPESDANFFESVRDLCSRYNLTSPVRRSRLSLVPT
jgi:hypothetical protein